MLQIPFNDDWFVQSDTPGSVFADKVGPLTIPHDAMIHEKRSSAAPGGSHVGYYPGGVYRYTKTITVPEEWLDRPGSIVTLGFEGVYHRSKVFVNGQLAGGRPYGYTLFYVDMIDLLHVGDDNVIQVVADNSEQPNSRWYTGSGIYRPIHLLLGCPSRIDPQGVRVRTISVDVEKDGDGSRGKAELEVTTRLKGQQAGSGPDGFATVSVKILDMQGNIIVGSRNSPIQSSYHHHPDTETTPDAEAEAEADILHRFSLKNANLWSDITPTLHQVHVELLDSSGNVVDQSKDTFGIRLTRVDSTRGFQINGRTVKLRGSCVHHDNGVMGAVSLDAAEERKVLILKRAGYNAIRSSHYPANSGLLRACDKHGIFVMDELTDVWLDQKVQYDYGLDYKQWWERDLEAMVARDYNHPCVVMYSIGNEIGECAYPRGIQQSEIMATRIRELDPTRPSVNSINGVLSLMHPEKPKDGANAIITGDGDNSNKSFGQITLLNTMMNTMQVVMPFITTFSIVDRRSRGTFEAVDIAGYNYMYSRYAADAVRYPDRVMVGSETGPGELAIAWPIIEATPSVIGDFVWTGWDYLGEANLGGPISYNGLSMDRSWPAHLSGESVIDITGHWQTQAYINRMIFQSDQGPHIAVRPPLKGKEKRCTGLWRFTDSVQSWGWEGYETKWMVVEVYAKTFKVRLELDGKVIGTKKPSAAYGYQTLFDARYKPGTLLAVGLAKDGSEVSRTVLSSPGPSLKIKAEPESTRMKAGEMDLVFVSIELTDDAGVTKVKSDRLVTVRVQGSGSLAGLGSGEAVSDGSFSSGQHTTYFGRAQAVVRSGMAKGQVKVIVEADGCEDVEILLEVV